MRAPHPPTPSPTAVRRACRGVVGEGESKNISAVSLSRSDSEFFPSPWAVASERKSNRNRKRERICRPPRDPPLPLPWERGQGGGTTPMTPSLALRLFAL